VTRSFLTAFAQGGALILAWGSSTAHADENDPEHLQVVIVSAEKRAENVQDVPISLQVISNETLKERNFVSLTDLAQTLPGVHMGTEANSNSIYIRGIGSAVNAAFDQSVAMFSDDIYHGRSRMGAATFIDMDRVEVLKGPQSTFFGNNAIAGALNLVSKKPGNVFEGWARALYGQFGQYALEGAVGGPINEIFGARVAVVRNGVSEGWIDNINIGEHVPHINNEAGRLTLDLHATGALDVLMKLEASRNRTGGTFTDTPYQYSHSCPPPAPIPPDFGNLGLCAAALSLGVPIGLQQNKVSELSGQFQQLSTFEDALTINYRIGDITLTSVSGYYRYAFNSAADGAWLPVLYSTSVFPEHYHQFSQELRVASGTGNALEYMAGLYFQTDDLSFSSQSNDPSFGDVGFPQYINPYLAFAQGATQSERVYSAFGSLGWNVTDKLKLSAGLRGSVVRKGASSFTLFGSGPADDRIYGGFVPVSPEGQTALAAAFGIPAGVAPDSHRRDHALMPSARLQYRLTPRSMGYFRYERGFKAGGFNGGGLFVQSNLPFGPEHTDSYEVGLKSTFLDDKLLVNIDVFRSEYKGLQVTSATYIPESNAYTALVRNAASSRSQGAEFEGQWAISRSFRLSANITYLKSYYVDYKNASETLLQSYCSTLPDLTTYQNIPECLANPYQPGEQDLSGKPTDFAPRWSGSVSADYEVRLPAELKLIVEVTPYFSSSYFLGGVSDDPLGIQGSYIRWDARLALETDDGRWALDVIGKNLADRVIINGDQVAHQIQSKEMPRNVSLQLLYRF